METTSHPKPTPASARLTAYFEWLQQPPRMPPEVSRVPRYHVKKRRRWRQNASSQYVGRLLAEHLERTGISDREAGRRAAVSQSTVTRLIWGKRNVTRDTAARILASLRIDGSLDRLPDGTAPQWAVANRPPVRRTKR